MSIKCLCDKYHKLRLTGKAKIKAKIIGASTLRPKLCGVGEIKEKSSINLGATVKICGTSKIKAFTNSDLSISKLPCQDNASIKAVATIPILHVRSKLNTSTSKFKNKYTDKFAGSFLSMKKLDNFVAQQKLYPSGDVQSNGFVDQDVKNVDIYRSIDEGVFTGNYIEHGNSSVRLGDDNSTYIQPSSIATNGSFSYTCAVNPALIKTKHSFLFLRAAVPLENYGSKTSPLVEITNIKLQDPSGNLMVKYKDLSFRGDASYDSGKGQNYTTYISEPEINYGKLNQWEENFPVYEDNAGYELSFDAEVICLDDPFDGGFNKGYEEFDCSIPDFNPNASPDDYLAIDGSPISTRTQGPFLNPTHNLRISSIEICNSGSPRLDLTLAPFRERFLGFATEVQSEGQKIIKHIFPKRVMPYNFDTTIDPEIESTWTSNAYPDPEDAVSNLTQSIASGLLLGRKISDRALSTYIDLTNSSIQDSGKLIVEFQDERQTHTSFFKGRDYSPGDFSRSYDVSRVERTPIDDARYDNISKVDLVVTARKAPSSRDYALDVVGYSDDKILFVTEPVGGFLQNSVQGLVVNPNIVSSSVLPPDELGISSEAISDHSETVVYSNTIANSGGDHNILTQTPLVNSTLFKEYRVPLKIYNIFPEVGPEHKFNSSVYFEHLYLDIYPLPSGADISDMRLEVHYSPQNSIGLQTIGVAQDEQFFFSNMPLKIVPFASGIEYADLDRTKIPYAHDLKDSNGKLVPDNYSRRWRGVSGNSYYQPYDLSFDFSFQNDATASPFPSGYFNFAKYNTDSVLDSEGRSISGVFEGSLTSSDIYKNIGWRFNSNSLFSAPNTIHSHRSIEWSSSYKTQDSFDSAIRLSGSSKYITFDNIDLSDGFSVFVRFSPDEFGAGDPSVFQDGIIVSKYNSANDLEFAIGYENNVLCGYSSDTAGNVIKVESSVAIGLHSFPLATLLTYDTDDNKLRLYVDNESSDWFDINDTWDLLRAESSSFTKVNTNQDITLGYSSGFGRGARVFVTELGLSSRAIKQNPHIEDNNSYAGAENVFASFRKTPKTSNRTVLWDYVDSNIQQNWNLGEFRSCHFDNSFSRLTFRGDADHVEHHLVHDGLPYSSRTDLSMPVNLNASGLAYHTQIENDFLRLNIEDVPETSGKFYAAAPRITKSLPRGYNFAEEAVTVDTVLEHITDDSIVWNEDDPKVGPKLIVSLYSPVQVPSYDGADKSLGLINRHIHHLLPSGCIHKISSTFDYDNLVNESEPWALFNRNKEHIIKEFDHKYYSTNINDMFLQYDLVYPSGSSFDSTIKIHAAQIRLKDCLRNIPSTFENFNLSVSGEFVQRENLPLYVISHSSISDSGLPLFASGFIPSSINDQMNLAVSGGTWYSDRFNLFVSSHQTISSFGGFGSSSEDMFGSSNYGLPLYADVSNDPDYRGTAVAPFNLTAYNDKQIDVESGILNLTSFISTKALRTINSSVNLVVEVPSVIDLGRFSSESMNLATYKRDVFAASTAFPLNLVNYYEAIPPSSVNDSLNLYTINYPAFDTALTQQQVVKWNGKNTGTSVLVTDDDYLTVDVDDEIRGVTTICYGDCGETNLCLNDNVTTHDTQWIYNDCHAGGVVRAKDTYTNIDLGYDNSYYGARKYTGLIPSYPYIINVRGFTGSTDLVELPRMIENIEYGTEPDDVNFSGIKLFTEDPYGLHAKYGKDVVTKGDLLAVGAPEYTLYEDGKELDKSGAVFLYRRKPEPTKENWPSSKSGWELEDILTLPSGFHRDFYVTKYQQVQDIVAPVRHWDIGNYGRKFGHSLDIAVDEETGKELIVVGAPQGKFDRDFTEIVPEPIKIAIFVVTDEFSGFMQNTNPPQSASTLFSNIVNLRNQYFLLYANPSFNVDIDVIILEPNKNVPFHEFKEFTNNSDFIHRFEISRKLRGSDINQLTVLSRDEIVEAFHEVYPYDTNIHNNNIPSVVSLIVDESASCGRSLVPGLDSFLDYYKEYSFASGVKTWDNIPVSGATLDVGYQRDNEEDWVSFGIQNINYTLSDVVINDNRDLFASGYGLLFAEDDYRFNQLPPSGGRLYLFERQPYASGLFHDDDGYDWNVTQQFGLDLHKYNEYSPNEGYGFSVAVSDNMENIVVGSPFSDSTGATVYELGSLSNRNLLNNLIPWLNFRAEERALDGEAISDYTLLYREYQKFLSQGVNSFGAAQKTYDLMNSKYKFDLCNWHSFYNGKQKYEQSFKYHNNYNIQGKYTFYPENFIAHPRVGYSVDVNEDGTILAIGCPTDSMNQWDDANVWYRNRRECSEEKNYAAGQGGGYQSPFDSEAHLQNASSITSAGTSEGTWPSYVNAGAVQVFNGRKYYPHNKIVEYGIFGNAHELYNDEENVANDIRSFEYNIVSGVFTNQTNVEFEKTSFVDPEIPQDAGALVILSPAKDSLSDEVLENIKQWLAYGDRNLIIVSDDPVFEANGFYEETNRIVNKILDKLDSRMRVYPAKNELYSQISPTLSNNVVPARVPFSSINHNINTPLLYASGVSDIRLYDTSIDTYHHSCDGDDFDQLLLEAQTFLNQDDLDQIQNAGGLKRYTYDTANIGCEQEIKHEGDLRAQWYDWCTDIKRNYHRVPRNIPAAYGAIPGLVDPTCDKGQPCDKATGCEFNARNQNVPPVPLLAIGEKSPEFTLTVPGSPESTTTVVVGFNEIKDPTKDSKRVGTPRIEEPVMNWDAIAGSPEYSGNYISDPVLSVGNLFTETSKFFKPEDLDRPYILQSRDSTFQEPDVENVHASDFANIVAEESYQFDSTSSIVLIASVTSESQDVLESSFNDSAILFYRNLLTRNDQVFDADSIFDLDAKDINVAQLGGWTKRTSFVDGYQDSYIYRKSTTGFDTGLVATNVLFEHIKNIDLNVTVDELLNGRSGATYANYDVCWIANTKYEPSLEELEKLKSWLARGNKKLIITYSHDPELVSESTDVFVPSIQTADTVTNLCQNLGLGMKPMYLTGKGKYAQYVHDSYTPADFNPRAPVPPEFVQSHYLAFINNTSQLSKFEFYTSPSPRAIGSSVPNDETGFIPIDLNGANRVASIIGRLSRDSRYGNSIFDEKSISIRNHYNNSGFAKVEFDIPTQESGYYVELGFYTDSPIERTSEITVAATNLNRFYKGQVDKFGNLLTLNKIGLEGKQDITRGSELVLDKQVGEKIKEKATGAFNKLKLGPFFAHADNTEIYISTNDFDARELSPEEAVPYTPKLAYVSGFPCPISEIAGFTLEPIYEDRIVPAIPDKEVLFTPPLRELGSIHTKYCPTSSCDDGFDQPLNNRGGDSQQGWEARYLAGDNIKTIDGPVVVAQEIEILSPFIAGFNRSRITVISDASIIQGSGALTDAGGIGNELASFIQSLYPYTDFSEVSTGKHYSLRNKIVSPERGSPYKWYSAAGHADLISRFNPNNNVIARSAMADFVGHESEYDPTYVHRPMFFWECEDFPGSSDFDPNEAIKSMIAAFGSDLNSNFSAGFSGIVDGQPYGDDLSLYKDKGYDFLDFEHFPNGYPGDLFGYSVKLYGDKLFVGAPFSAYHQESGVVKWSDISSTLINTTPSGVELSAFGGAGAVYLFQNTQNGIGAIREQAVPWEYIRKFRPDSVNVGQDYTSILEADADEELGLHGYSTTDLVLNSKHTDRFGYDIDVDAGILAIGAPGHDFENYSIMSEAPYQNKAFGNAFDIRRRTVYDLGSSGVRSDLPNSGIAVLNNGSVYIYSEDYSFDTNELYWRKLEKVVPQGYNSHKQKAYDGSEAIPEFGSENSHFGESVSVARRRRTDADYTLAVGSKNHPFTSGETYMDDHGAGYTYDMMLRRPQPVGSSEDASIHARVFGHSGVNYNSEEITNEIKFSIINRGDDSKAYYESGVIYTNPRGELFVEVSGQDPSKYGFIQHRPFIESINGRIKSGLVHTNAIRLNTEGRPDEVSGIMNLSTLASDSAFVYNNMGLYNFGVDGIIQESGLNLTLELENAPVVIENSGLFLLASGVGQNTDTINLRIRGF
jgi:hypothetical protein